MVPLVADEKQSTPLKWQQKQVKFSWRGKELLLSVGSLVPLEDSDGFVTCARVCTVGDQKFAILERGLVQLAWIMIHDH